MKIYNYAFNYNYGFTTWGQRIKPNKKIKSDAKIKVYNADSWDGAYKKGNRDVGYYNIRCN